MLEQLRVVISDGTQHTMRLLDGQDAGSALMDLLDGSTTRAIDWVQTERGAWLRRDAIIAAFVCTEESFSLDDVMALSADDQEDFFSRHPVPDLHRPSIPLPDGRSGSVAKGRT